MGDNPNIRSLEDIDAAFRREYLQQWPETKRQCMTTIFTGVIRGDRCPNEATFTVGFRNGEAQDVCRTCLIVVCETANDEVVVMKVRSR